VGKHCCNGVTVHLKTTPYFSLTKAASNELKGLAIVLVIFSHLGLNLKLDNGVGLFLLLSGFGLAESYLETGLTRFFLKRLPKVYIPYLAVTVVWILVDVICFERHYPWQSIALNLCGLSVAPYIDGTMWFIPYILIWYCLFYVVFKYFKNNNLRSLLLFVASLLFLFTDSIINPGGAPRTYMCAFPLGVLIGLKFTPWQQTISKKRLIPICSAVFASCLIIFLMIQFEKGIYHLFGCFHHDLINISLKRLSFTIMAAMMFSLGAGRRTAIRPLGLLGTIAFEMYLVEAKMITYFHLSEIANPFCRGLSAIMAAGFAAYLLRHLVRLFATLAVRFARLPQASAIV
jgi:peptidoglycan/LPS O-acetylase OafA/YrhL